MYRDTEVVDMIHRYIKRRTDIYIYFDTTQGYESVKMCVLVLKLLHSNKHLDKQQPDFRK